MSTRIFEAKQPYIAMGAFVDPTAVVIGDVEVGENSSIWPRAILRGDVHAIRIGERCNIQDGAVLHVTHPGPYTGEGKPLVIGDAVTVGHSANLHACTIKSNCLIGIGSIVLDGAIINSNVILAAGSIVPPGKELESGFLYMGSPAEKVRELTDEEKQSIAYSADQYTELKDRYLLAFQRSRERERERERERI